MYVYIYLYLYVGVPAHVPCVSTLLSVWRRAKTRLGWRREIGSTRSCALPERPATRIKRKNGPVGGWVSRVVCPPAVFDLDSVWVGLTPR